MWSTRHCRNVPNTGTELFVEIKDRTRVHKGSLEQRKMPLVDSQAPSRVANKCVTAVDDAEVLKDKKYVQLASLYIFQPIASDCLGMWGCRSIAFLKKVGEMLGRATTNPRAGYHFRQKPSVAIARGNYKSISGTLPRVLFDNAVPEF